jgi:hypothetical protein
MTAANPTVGGISCRSTELISPDAEMHAAAQEVPMSVKFNEAPKPAWRFLGDPEPYEAPSDPCTWMHSPTGPGGTARCGRPATQRQMCKPGERPTCPGCRL